MFLITSAGPLIALADAKQPSADGLMLYAWRKETLAELFPTASVKTAKAKGPAPFHAVIARRDLARLLTRQLSALQARDAAELCADDSLLRVATAEVLGLFSSLDWSSLTPSPDAPPIADPDPQPEPERP